MASVSIVKIKIRRGTEAERRLVVLDSGELGFTTDSKRIFVGDGLTQGGLSVGCKLYSGNLNDALSYSNAVKGDLFYDVVSTKLYTVQTIDYSTPSPTYSFSTITVTEPNLNMSLMNASTLPTSNPGSGKLWVDTSAGNVVKRG